MNPETLHRGKWWGNREESEDKEGEKRGRIGKQFDDSLAGFLVFECLTVIFLLESLLEMMRREILSLNLTNSVLVRIPSLFSTTYWVQVDKRREEKMFLLQERNSQMLDSFPLLLFVNIRDEECWTHRITLFMSQDCVNMELIHTKKQFSPFFFSIFLFPHFEMK